MRGKLIRLVNPWRVECPPSSPATAVRSNSSSRTRPKPSPSAIARFAGGWGCCGRTMRLTKSGSSTPASHEPLCEWPPLKTLAVRTRRVASLFARRPPLKLTPGTASTSISIAAPPAVVSPIGCRGRRGATSAASMPACSIRQCSPPPASATRTAPSPASIWIRRSPDLVRPNLVVRQAHHEGT